MKAKILASAFAIGLAFLFVYNFHVSSSDEVSSWLVAEPELTELTGSRDTTDQPKILTCDDRLVIDDSISNQISQLILQSTRNRINSGADLRLLTLALGELKLPVSKIVSSALSALSVSGDFSFEDAGYSNVYDAVSDDKREQLIDYIQRNDLNNLFGLLSSSEFDQTYFTVQNGQVFTNVTKYGLALSFLKQDVDEFDAQYALETLSLHGIFPTTLDIASAMVWGFSVSEIDYLNTELKESSFLKTGPIPLGAEFGNVTLLSLSIRLERLDLLEYWLSDNIVQLGQNADEILGALLSDDSEFSSKALLLLLQHRVNPISVNISNKLSLSSIISEEYSELESSFTYNFEKLSPETKLDVKSLSIEMLAEVTSLLSVNNVNSSPMCERLFTLGYLYSTDWTKDRESESNITEEGEFLASLRTPESKFIPNSMDEKNVDNEIVFSEDSDIDAFKIPYEINTEARRLIADGKNSELASLLTDKYGLTREESAFYRMYLASMANDGKEFVSLLSEVGEAVPTNIYQRAILFDNPIKVLSAMNELGLNLDRKYHSNSTNLLVSFAVEGNFEAFEYLTMQGNSLRPSEHHLDAIDAAIYQFVEKDNSKFLEVTLEQGLTPRGSNFTLIDQLKASDREKYDELINKFPQLGND
ncbi:hypothetical protein PN836_018995 [Ningiella sp. W23]|uniref:hypothetical protein n=1 Tax=Ningiella sp. W23 TaxID=3023715 RepID=UPI00375664D9